MRLNALCILCTNFVLQMGVVAVWALDDRGRLKPLATYRRSGSMSQVAFNRPVTTMVSGAAAGASAVATLTSFFIAGEAGVVTYADDLGHAVEALAQSNSPVDLMHMHTPGGSGGVSQSTPPGEDEEEDGGTSPDILRASRHSDPDVLIVITRNLLMTQLLVNGDGTLTPRTRVKMATAAPSGLRMGTWISPGVLATASQDESMVRFWGVGSQDGTGQLRLSHGLPAVASNDRISALAFDPMRSILAVGTRDGHVIMWRHRGSKKLGSKAWTPYQAKPVAEAAVEHLSWCGSNACLAVGTQSNVYALSETVMHRVLTPQLAVTQDASSSIVVHVRGQRSAGRISGEAKLTAPYTIRGVFAAESHVMTWSGAQVDIFQVAVSSGAEVTLTSVGSFLTSAKAVGLTSESVWLAGAENQTLQVVNFGGVVKTSLKFTALEGTPNKLSMNGKFAAVSTDAGRIKLYKTSRLEPRLLHEGVFEHAGGGGVIGAVLALSVNADGTKAALTAASRPVADISAPGGKGVSVLAGVASSRAEGGFGSSASASNQSSVAAALAAQTTAVGSRRMDTNVYVYDGKLDTVLSHDIGPARLPMSHQWDLEEPKLLSVQSERLGNADGAEDGVDGDEEDAFSPSGMRSEGKGGEGKEGSSSESALEVFTFFATTEADGALRVQDSTPIQSDCSALLGIDVPNAFYTLKETGAVGAKPLRDFVGIDSADGDTRSALLDFSYYMATGNMDAAYQAVQNVDNTAVWTNMAHMCVKSKRLDVAQVCLAHMGHIRGLRALRQAIAREPEVDAQVAMLAIQLGLLSEAVKLYLSAGRYDLLNMLYRRAGLWKKAEQVAESKDRIHASSTHFAVARHYEATGQYTLAIGSFEAAGVAVKEVPRMLIDARRVRELRDYVTRTDNPKLTKWWGQYLESNGEIDRAMQCYERAESKEDMVRVLAMKGDLDSAARLVQESPDSPAAYQLARQYEMAGNTDAALYFYEKSGRFNHAARLSKSSGKDSQLMALALQSTKDVMLETAEYFVERGALDKAVPLFHKGGATSKALEMCFQGQLFDDLQAIADDLGDGEDADPEVLQQCAEFFMQHGQYDKAVSLLLAAQQHEEALTLCAEHRVTITEEMAESLTLPKYPLGASPVKNAASGVGGERPPPADWTDRRNMLLVQLGETLERQGDFRLAARKFTQAGDKMRAMKSLLRSGDTEKIVFFTNLAKSKEIYVLAANYLQSLDWHAQPKLMKSIVQFYGRARAYNSLAMFYDSCAAMEMNEFRNYETALGALQEAAKYAGKIKSADKDATTAMLQHKIGVVQQFVSARQLAKSDPQQMIDICVQLTQDRRVEQVLRVGDVYAVLVEWSFMQRDMASAHRYLAEMEERGLDLESFVESKVVDSVYAAVGATRSREDDGGIDEDIKEEF